MNFKQFFSLAVLTTAAVASPLPLNDTAMTPRCTSTSARSTLTAGFEEGRPGKVPYRRFPQCYVDCFDSEGTDDKTWPAIGDIRDLTTEEFCHTQWTWVGTWFKEHLQFCTGGACAHCSPQCNEDAKTYFDSLCGRPG
ncbi:hypothetical protein SUNI508_07712 [Seiridium unicorne]|uniref:Uncharacterized protein n=1 Tax=Seiridium unicorne TaxID=138068 RepID=A0ABR2UVY6_9PEZI